MQGITRTVLVLIAIGLLRSAAQADEVQLGQITLAGTFTRNSSYDFNRPEAFPFGTFSTMTVQGSTGIFAPYVTLGDLLNMNTVLLWISPFGVMRPPPHPLLWSVGGFTFDTKWDLITGADSQRHAFGIIDLSGNGFDPSAYGLGARSSWSFFSFASHTDITMTINVSYNDGHVPEGGSTLILLAIGVTGLGLLRQRGGGSLCRFGKLW